MFYFPVDGGQKSVVLAALNQNVQKWNLFVQFKVLIIYAKVSHSHTHTHTKL